MRELTAAETETFHENLSSAHSTPSVKTLSPKTINAPDLTISPKSGQGQIDQIIAEERRQIERAAATTEVAIYKIENTETGKCYIGQTTNPDRREKEHFKHSSNDRLRQAIRHEGATQFNFKVIERGQRTRGEPSRSTLDRVLQRPRKCVQPCRPAAGAVQQPTHP